MHPKAFKSMRVRILSILFLPAVLLCMAVDVFASSAPFRRMDPDQADMPVNIRAVSLSYDKMKENLFAHGSVEITQGNRVLKADSVKINLTTSDADAQGNVRLFENGDVLTCESFSINLDSQVGSVKSATIFLKQDNIHITGTDIKKLGINTYEIQNGTVTTCDGETPPWRIDAGKINVTVEGYAWVKNSVFRIKKIPVFYFPFAVLPVKTKRQTGFLFPELGHSTSKGTEFNNSFFWAISENTDTTIWLDAATKKGLGTGLEYRFKLKEDTWGKLYGFTATEKDSYFDDEYNDRRDREKQRQYLNIEGEHYFDQNSYIKTLGSYISDRELYGDYRTEVNRSSGEVLRTHIRSLEKDESLAFYNKNWDRCNLLVNVDSYKNLTRSDHYVLQRLPQIVFSTMKLPLFSSPLFFQFDSSYDYFWRDAGRKGHRIDLFPRIALPYVFNGWLKLSPEIGLHALSYAELEDDKNLDRTGLFPSLRADLSANFFRIFSFKSDLIEKIKHTVEPGISYEYISDNDQTDMPAFDYPEQFFSRHSITYYLKNRFAGLYRNPAGELEEYEVGYCIIGRSYHFRSPSDGLYLDGDPAHAHSDIFGELRFGVWPRLYAVTKAAYAPSDSRFRYYKALINISGDSDSFLRFGYIYEWDRFKGFDVKGRFHVTGPVAAFFDARYNNNRRDKMDTEFGIDYSEQCWGSRITIETRGASSGRRSDTSFYYRFYLKGLGKKML